MAASSRSSRRATRVASSALIAIALATSACSKPPKPHAASAPQEAPFFRLPVPASADSALKLARNALGAVRGQLQQARIQRDLLIISTQYTRERKNGGHTQVTLIAAIDRKPARAEPVTTMVELSAWAIDIEPEVTQLVGPRTGRELPTLTTTSPLTMSTSQRQPYRITRKDNPLEWLQLEEVLNALVDLTTKP